MLCPKHTSCYKWILNRVGSKPISPKRAEIWIWGLEKCIRKEEAQPHFSPRSRENWTYGWGKWEKKVYEKRGKQEFVLTNWQFIIKVFCI